MKNVYAQCSVEGCTWEALGNKHDVDARATAHRKTVHAEVKPARRRTKRTEVEADQNVAPVNEDVVNAEDSDTVTSENNQGE